MFGSGEAGMVGCVRVVCGKSSSGALGQARLGEFRWVAFWLGRRGFVWHLRIGTFSLGKLR